MHSIRWRGAAIVLGLLWSGYALGEVRIAGPTSVPAGKLVRLEAQGDLAGAGLIWDVNDEEKADAQEYGKKLVFTGPAGSYRVKLRAVRSKDGVISIETARLTVVIGDPVPPPPGPDPDPGPGPKPPVPPTPPDPLVAKLQAAYTLDPGPPAEKAKWLGMLGALYGAGSKACLDSSIKTAGDLLSVQKRAFDLEIPPTALVGVRKVAQAELAAVLPDTADTPLTDAARKAASDVFTRLNKAAGAIK